MCLKNIRFIYKKYDYIKTVFTQSCVWLESRKIEVYCIDVKMAENDLKFYFH